MTRKVLPIDKFNKSTRRISMIYFSMAPFINYMKFPLWNLNITNLMLINFHILLITKRFLRSFDRHSDKTATLSELLPNINKFRNKIFIFFQKVSCGFLIVRVIVIHVLNPFQFFSRNALEWIHTVLLLQRIAELSPPSYILYTLGEIHICVI